MKKNLPVIIACILIVCSIVMLISHYGTGKEEKELYNDPVVDVETQYIDDNQEIEYSDETSKYDINEEYFDQDFVIHMKDVKYDEISGFYEFTLNFRNMTDEARKIEYSRIFCDVNQQSVAYSSGVDFTVDAKKNIDVELRCVALKEDVVSIAYVSTLFNGQNVTVKFGKKS